MSCVCVCVTVVPQVDLQGRPMHSMTYVTSDPYTSLLGQAPWVCLASLQGTLGLCPVGQLCGHWGFFSLWKNCPFRPVSIQASWASLMKQVPTQAFHLPGPAV